MLTWSMIPRTSQPWYANGKRLVTRKRLFMETCYKLIPGILARSLPMEGRRFEIEPEITSCILQVGYQILEVPISYKPRVAKKLNPWKDGWPALAMLLRRRFSQPFRFVQPQEMSTPEIKADEEQTTPVR